MKNLIAVAFLLSSFISNLSYSQCTMETGGPVCSTAQSYVNKGGRNVRYAWDSLKITGNSFFVLTDSNATTDYMIVEVQTHSHQNIEVWALHSNWSFTKYNYNNYSWNGYSGNEDISYAGYKSGITIRLYGDSCSPITDTFYVYYRKICEYKNKSNATFAGKQEWAGGISKAIPGNNARFWGPVYNQPINFSIDAGHGVPTYEGNCPICSASSNVDSFVLNMYIDTVLVRGFYNVICNTQNRVELRSTGPNGIFSSTASHSRNSVKRNTPLIIPTGNVGQPPLSNVQYSNISYNGRLSYQLYKDTDSFVADFNLCKMDGDYTWGINRWNAYVFDKRNPNYVGDVYQGYFITDSSNFSYDWGRGQPTVRQQSCGVSMNDSDFIVKFLMKKNFDAGKYKVRVRSKQGGGIRLTNVNGLQTYNIGGAADWQVNGYDVTSPYMQLYGDTFFAIEVTQYDGNPSRISFVSCKEPKNTGNITVSRDTVCVGGQVTLTVDTADGTETQWFKKACGGTGGIYVGSGASITVTMDTSTTFFVRNRNLAVAASDTINKLDIYSPNCSSKRITVVSIPQPPVAPSPQTVCDDTAHVFTFSGINAGAGGNQIEWSLNSLFSSSYTIASGSSIVHTVNIGNTDTIWLRSRHSGGGCLSASVTSHGANFNKPLPPTGINPKAIAADSAYSFTFENVLAGIGGTQVEWSFDSLFSHSTINSSPTAITVLMPVNSDTLIWLRSIDSLNGCISDATATILINSSLVTHTQLIDSSYQICAGNSISIPIQSSTFGVRYYLRCDTNLVDSAWGNGAGIVLYSPIIDSNTLFNVLCVDTILDTTSVKFYIAALAFSPVDTPGFIEPKTLITKGDTAYYFAVATNSIFIKYGIIGNGAKIDSISGMATNIDSDFIVRAIAYGLPGCDTLFTDLFVTTTDISPPIVPNRLEFVVDTPGLYSITIDSVLAGVGGNEIEWSTTKDFNTSTIINSPATINIDLWSNEDTILYIRSRNSRTNKHSEPRELPASTRYILQSAGLLDKSKWTLDPSKSDEFSYNTVTNTKLQDFHSANKWALNYAWACTNSCSGTTYSSPWDPADCGNHTLWGHPGEPELYNYGNYDGHGAWDGCGGEVSFGDGIAHLKATKLPQMISTTCGSKTCNFTYKSGMLCSKEEFSLAQPGMFEIRCKRPSKEEAPGSWPAFWFFGANELDIFDDTNWGTNVQSQSRIIDYGRPFTNSNGDIDHVSCGGFSINTSPCDYSEDWHTWTMVVTPFQSTSEIVFFIDGKEIWSEFVQPAPNQLPKNYLGSGRIIINHAIWDSDNCIRDVKWPEADFEVDYFRYYTASTGNPSVPGTQAEFLQDMKAGVAQTLHSPNGNTPVVNNHILYIANANQHISCKLSYKTLGLFKKNNNETVLSYITNGNLPVVTNVSSTGQVGVQQIIGHNFGLGGGADNFMTPFSENRIYYKSNNNLLAYLEKIGNQWYNWPTPWANGGHSGYINNCAGYIKVDNLGRIWYLGTDKNIWVYYPSNFGLERITNTGNIYGPLVIADCGCLIFYRDANFRLNQMYWWNSWFNLGPVGPTSIVYGELVLDQEQGRVYGSSIGGLNYYYQYSYSSINTSGFKGLTTSNTDQKNNYRPCLDGLNSTLEFDKHLTINSKRKKLYYKSATDGSLWYYYNDQEGSAKEIPRASFDNWYRSVIYPHQPCGPIAFEPGDFGNLFYSGYNQRLSRINWTMADNPVMCSVDETSLTNTFVQLYKTDSVIQEVEKTLDKHNLIVFPNPSSERYNFQLDGLQAEQVIEIQIFDLGGRTLEILKFRSKAGLNYFEWNTQNNSSGVYFYKVGIDNERPINGKLIKL